MSDKKEPNAPAPKEPKKVDKKPWGILDWIKNFKPE